MKLFLNILLIGTSLSTLCSATEFQVEQLGSIYNVIKSNSPNHRFFNGNYSSDVHKESGIFKCPTIEMYQPETHSAYHLCPDLMMLLPDECNVNVPKEVTQLPPNQLKVFLTAPELWESEEYYGYCPHFATDPNATAKGYHSWRTGTVRLVDSDTKSVFLKKIAMVCGKPNEEVFAIDPIPSGPIAISQAYNKQVILHPDTGQNTILSPTPVQISGLKAGQSDSFWTCFEYVEKGQKQAVVGLHWVHNPIQLKELSNTMDRMKKIGTMTRAVFLREMERLGDTDAFKNDGHVRKLLSLFNRNTHTYSIASDGMCPFPFTGFSGQEHTHRWTLGKKAQITIPHDYKIESVSFINTKGLITNHHSQEVSVSLNGILNGKYVYNTVTPAHTINLNLPKDVDAVIEFDLPNASSPAALGINTDPRELCLMFNEIKVTQYFPLIRHAYSFAAGGVCPFRLSGFSSQEIKHRWTEGKKAALGISLKDSVHAKSRILSFINTTGFVPDQHVQEVSVSLNSVFVQKYIYRAHSPKKRINIAIPDGLDFARIEFDIPNAIAPATLGISSDPREVGVMFTEAELTY